MLADGIIDLCGVDTVGVSSVTTAGELDVFGYDSVVSDETGEVVSVDDVVACGDDPLLPDAVRVGGHLSVVDDTLVCGAGVARSGRGDTEAVVGSEVAQRGWVDGLICADGSLRPEPPPMHTQCVCVALSDLCVGRTLSIPVLLPQCLLQVETWRCPHCLNCCMYCQHDACSKWRQGGARIIGLSDFCVGMRLPITILLLQQCLLQVQTGRCPHCLNCCMSCHHDVCSKWRTAYTLYYMHT